MKTAFVLFAIVGMTIGMEGCAGIQKVSDVFATVDKLHGECYVGVNKLTAAGIVKFTPADCDTAAKKLKSDLQVVVDKVRAEIAKAGL